LSGACPHCAEAHPTGEAYCPNTGKPLARRSIRVGDVLEGKYQVVRELGAGAMGVVFEARHRALNKRVAVKTLHPELSQNAELVARFHQEAQAASAIGHPNIVEVFDLGAASGVAYMVMELLQGRSLAEVLAHEPLMVPERIGRLMADVLAGLAAAHTHGIIHRDLKPENIFVAKPPNAPEIVKVLDFGIAKVVDRTRGDTARTPKPTQFGTLLGTPQYMSPEQARGRTDLDHRVDIWAAGCVLYEGLCGRVPFEGDNYNQVLVSIVDGAFPRPSTLRPSVSPAIEAVVLRAMAYDRDERFADASEMRAALIAALSAGAERARPDARTVGQRGAPAGAPTTSVTGLAAAGGDAAFDVSALDRLGDGALVGLDGADEPVAPTTPATPAAPAAAARRQVSRAADASAVPPASAFAPPVADAAELALDVDPAALKPQRPRRTPAQGTRTSPTRRAAPPPRPRGRLGAAVALGLLFAALGVAFVVGYRYATLGYVLAPAPPPPVAVDLELEPAVATIEVDGRPLRERTFLAVPGHPYRLESRAPGRLGVRLELPAASPPPASVRVRLPQAMAALADPLVPLAASADEVADLSASAVDRAFDKLRRIAGCLDATATRIAESREAYAASDRGGRLDDSEPPRVLAVSSDAVLACRAGIAAAVDAAPAMPRLEPLATAYMEQLAGLTGELSALARYYAGGDH
jgi:serine/threonine-protein kinase